MDYRLRSCAIHAESGTGPMVGYRDNLFRDLAADVCESEVAPAMAVS